ncbi:MAG: hypothetical protein RL701_2253 [Pseudomonadota bacterium]
MRKLSGLRGSFIGACALALGLLAGSATTHADDSMRCKNRIVSLGDTLYDVQALCGPPDFTEKRVERRAVGNQVRSNCAPGARCTSAIVDSIEVTIDQWTYDFGTNRFVQYLTFEAGKLIAVRTGNYGHKTPQ